VFWSKAGPSFVEISAESGHVKEKKKNQGNNMIPKSHPMKDKQTSKIQY